MPSLPFSVEAGGLRLYVRLTPRGGRNAIEGIRVMADGRPVLTARVSVPAQNGAANRALEALIAEELSLKKSAVRVITGGAGRRKTVAIEGDCDRLIAALNARGRR